MATLLLYIGLALGGLGLVYGVWHSVDTTLEHHYADPVRAKAAKDIAVVEKRASDAEISAASLRAERVNVEMKIAASNVLVDGCAADGEAMRRRRLAAEAANKPRLDALAAQNINLYAELMAKDTGGTCDERLQKLDAGLRDWGRERLRYNPAPAGGAPAPASGQGANSGALRIGQ